MLPVVGGSIGSPARRAVSGPVTYAVKAGGAAGSSSHAQPGSSLREEPESEQRYCRDGQREGYPSSRPRRQASPTDWAGHSQGPRPAES